METLYSPLKLAELIRRILCLLLPVKQTLCGGAQFSLKDTRLGMQYACGYRRRRLLYHEKHAVIVPTTYLRQAVHAPYLAHNGAFRSRFGSYPLDDVEVFFEACHVQSTHHDCCEVLRYTLTSKEARKLLSLPPGLAIGLSMLLTH